MTASRLGATIVALVLLTACSAPAQTSTAPVEPTEPEATPMAEASPTPNAPPQPVRDVPVTSSSLSDRSPSATSPRPVEVELPRLDARVDVEPVGVAEDGQMAIPDLAETAGWYRFGAAPTDEEGTVVIAAHVDSIASAGLGPFAALSDAQAGDVVEVRLEDGSTATYAVEGVDRRGKQGIDWEEVFVRDGEPRLVLITCGGRFLRDVGHYEDNVLVWAVPRGAHR